MRVKNKQKYYSCKTLLYIIVILSTSHGIWSSLRKGVLRLATGYKCDTCHPLSVCVPGLFFWFGHFHLGTMPVITQEDTWKWCLWEGAEMPILWILWIYCGCLKSQPFLEQVSNGSTHCSPISLGLGFWVAYGKVLRDKPDDSKQLLTHARPGHMDHAWDNQPGFVLSLIRFNWFDEVIKLKIRKTEGVLWFSN